MTIASQFPVVSQAEGRSMLRALALAPGQIVEGRVLGPGQAGSTLVQIGRQAMSLSLPSALPAGSLLTLGVQQGDGHLRLALIDKVKTKAGSTVKHRTQFKAKLVVNPDLYRVNATPVDGSTAPIHVYSEGQGTLSINAEVDPQRLPVEHILKSLKAMYAYLEPIRQIRRISI